MLNQRATLPEKHEPWGIASTLASLYPECRNTRRSDALRMTKSLHVALTDLELDRAWIVDPGGERYAAHANVEVLPLTQVPDRLPFLAGPAQAAKRSRNGQAR